MVVMVSLFKYGDQVSTNLQLAAEFRSQCLDPVAIDRAGAAAEGVITSIMASIKSRWTHVLQGQEISWRRWATVIAKLNRNVHEAEMHVVLQPHLSATLISLVIALKIKLCAFNGTYR